MNTPPKIGYQPSIIGSMSWDEAFGITEAQYHWIEYFELLGLAEQYREVAHRSGPVGRRVHLRLARTWITKARRALSLAGAFA